MDSLNSFFFNVIVNIVGGGIIVFVAILFVLGFIWAPFAAMLSILIARRRRQPSYSGCSIGLIGGFYSLLFFLPWVYLTVRMYGINFPRIVVIMCCVLVFAAWASLIGGYIVFWITEGSHYPNVYGLSILANVALWVYSLWNLWRRRIEQNKERQANTSAAQDITHPPISSVELPGAYLMPIVLSYLSIWIFIWLWSREFKLT
jgi:hypothetical protein